MPRAQRSAGNPTYRETMAEAAALARRYDDPHRLAVAALGCGLPGGAAAGITADGTLVDLYAEAAAPLGSSDDLLRARLLGQLAIELVRSPERDRRNALSAEGSAASAATAR